MSTATAVMRVMGIICLLGLLVAAGSVYRSGPVEAASTAVSIDAPAEVVKGSTFTVTVGITDVAAFDAGQLDVSINESLVQLDDVTAGQIGATQVPVDLWTEVSSGTYRIIVNVPGVPGVSGSGSLAVLHLQAASSATGACAVGLSNGFLNNNLAVQIPATWTGGSVLVCDDVVITTSSVPDGMVGDTYSTSLTASGGSGSLTWSVSSGSLPAGLSLNASGTISGTPTTAGDFSFAVQATDGYLTDSRTFSIQISLEPGDANGDGAVDTADITKVERIIVGLDGSTSGADANSDGAVNSADVTTIERRIAGLV